VISKSKVLCNLYKADKASFNFQIQSQKICSTTKLGADKKINSKIDYTDSRVTTNPRRAVLYVPGKFRLNYSFILKTAKNLKNKI
jgi:hypothetical protein